MPALSTPASPLQPLRQVWLTQGVADRLFQEYFEHRKSSRGHEETGWLLLGLRETDAATVLATLPAGADRDAGESHVRFNSEAQVAAMRLLFPRERRLKLLGVVHTHPGTLRHPSAGDYQGDREWVLKLPGQQGIFGIGTTDPKPDEVLPRHAQARGRLRFDWYTLARTDKKYQRQPVEVMVGTDLAEDLRAIWPVLETHAAELDRLARQLNRVSFQVLLEPEPVLAMIIGLTEPGQSLQVLLQPNHRQLIYEVEGAGYQPDLPAEMPLEQTVYRFLQELARRDY